MARMMPAVLVVGVVSGGQIHASLPAQDPGVADRKSHIQLPTKAARVMETVLARVRLRLDSAECAAVFSDFAAKGGRSLHLLGSLVFRRCDPERTVPGESDPYCLHHPTKPRHLCMY
jgi:hypothetical protein